MQASKKERAPEDTSTSKYQEIKARWQAAVTEPVAEPYELAENIEGYLTRRRERSIARTDGWLALRKVFEKQCYEDVPLLLKALEIACIRLAGEYNGTSEGWIENCFVDAEEELRNGE